MKAYISPTLAVYIGSRFLAWVFGVSLLLSAVVLLGDSIELLRRTSNKPDVGFGLVLLMALSSCRQRRRRSCHSDCSGQRWDASPSCRAAAS
jgi:hypothetical protein